jgi:membrane protease YdiL (CAAX protease family)
LIKNIDSKKLVNNLNHFLIFFLFLVVTGSIFIGIYVVYFTNIGKDVSWHSDVLLNFLLLSILGISNIHFNLGIAFISFWFIYLVIFLICIFKPIFIFKDFLYNPLSKNKFKYFDFSSESFSSNYLYIIIQWFSAYFLLSVIIDLIQQSFGIQIGNPLVSNPLLSFFYLTGAPLNEEILFRVIFLGIPLSLIIFKYKNSFISSLLHPSKNISIKSGRDRNLLFLVILLNSVFFGLAHVIFGGNYEIGKITQASLGGMFLGWLYYRYGLGTSIIFHWISNYVIFSYGLLGSIIFNTSWSEESSNYFLNFVYVFFIIAGIIFTYQKTNVFLKYFFKNKKWI